jgi:hypothetical protein
MVFRGACGGAGVGWGSYACPGGFQAVLESEVEVGDQGSEVFYVACLYKRVLNCFHHWIEYGSHDSPLFIDKVLITKKNNALLLLSGKFRLLVLNEQGLERKRASECQPLKNL